MHLIRDEVHAYKELLLRDIVRELAPVNSSWGDLDVAFERAPVGVRRDPGDDLPKVSCTGDQEQRERTRLRFSPRPPTGPGREVLQTRRTGPA